MLSISSCGVYSFSGATIPPEVKTISIDYITSNAPGAWSSTERIFNNELKQKLISDAGLKLVDKDGDYQVKGYISSYNIAPQASTTGGFTNQYKLTISANIDFKDTKTDKKVEWNKPFSFFVVYQDDISGHEDDYITSISKNIANQIFNQIFSTW